MTPEGWSTTNLAGILDGSIKNGYSPNAATIKTGYWVLGLGALSDNGININEVKPANPTDKVLQSQLHSGDFLVSRSNTPDKVGRSILYKGEIANCSYPDLMMRFRINESKAKPEFIELKLKSYSVRNYFKRCAAGSSRTMVKINKPTLENTPLMLPPLVEQTKIANILSTWDKAIETVEKLINNSRTQKKSLMQQLLTGKKRLPGFNSEWKEHHLTDVAQIIVSPVDKKSKIGELPVELCNYTDVYYNTRITRRIEFMKATAKQSQIDKYSLLMNDVVITKDSETPGDIAVPALVSEDLKGIVCGYHLAIIRPKKEQAEGSYLNCLLSMPKTKYYFFTLANGATRFGLSIGAIQQALFNLPPIQEQQKISTVLSNADQEIEILQNKLNYFQQEKKALMQQLLTGKRRVKIDTAAST